VTRDQIIEVMADAIHDASNESDWISAETAASVALTAYESHLSAEGMAVVPVEKVEALDEHIGALLRIFEATQVQNEADAERVLQIATAFGERCLAAAKPQEQSK
jgi:hypothetical protein